MYYIEDKVTKKIIYKNKDYFTTLEMYRKVKSYSIKNYTGTLQVGYSCKLAK